MSPTMSTAENLRNPGQGGHEAHETGDSVLDRARERVGTAFQKVKDRGIDKEKELEIYVKDHPVKSVLVAAGIGAGIGLITGVLLGRR